MTPSEIMAEYRAGTRSRRETIVALAALGLIVTLEKGELLAKDASGTVVYDTKKDAVTFEGNSRAVSAPKVPAPKVVKK